MDSSTRSILSELLSYSVSKEQKLYIVGGTLRDILSLKPCTDFDLTGKNAAELASSFAHASSHTCVLLDNTPGRKTVRVILHKNQHLDVTDLQGENIETDLSQRDFTINAMGQELSDFLSKGKNILDPYAGQKDLKNCKIRVLEGPIFQSDPVRILRAFRFAATLGFAIETTTLEKIALYKSHLTKPAQERVWHELSLFLKTPNTLPLLKVMHDCGVLTCLFPHDNDIQGELFDPYQNLETILADPEKFFPDFSQAFNDSLANHYLLKFAVLLNRSEQNDSADITTLAQKWKLRASNAEINTIQHAIKGARYLSGIHSKEGHTATPPELYEWVQNIQEELLAAVILFVSRTQNAIPFCQHILKFYYQHYLPAMNEKPLINGNDLIQQFSLTPSPLFGKILDQTQKAQVLGTITSQKEALELAEAFIKHPLPNQNHDK
ncbi:MAG: CCA tRNA nucleotidyltransferase [Nitrospinaceae bacterium]|jgi:tRNA nucleotidyltransferase/poly(A) polymerase|nr:CCA tRNA nucleotidyltransferase [Nitrospina sp.]MBT5867580.1 CCA tRNA nucleotidyltransferase [Nitrospinaceae bacterium]